MSSSSESVDSDSSSSSISIPNISKLQPYDLEPTIPSSEVSSSSNSDEGTSDSEQEKERIGNTDWCVCGGKCRPMESYTESLCCRETNEVPDEYFEGETYQTSLIFSVTSEKL